MFVVFCACVYMWSLLFASDCGDLCSKSFVLVYICGLSCVLVIVEPCVRSLLRLRIYVVSCVLVIVETCVRSPLCLRIYVVSLVC